MDMAEFGERLRLAGFRPLPEVDDYGRLAGMRFWRVRDGCVEYLVAQTHGLAHAVRARAEFDYRKPFEHGVVIGDKFGSPAQALDWLIR
ncbi:hypothetical protein [Amycolatopsis sp. NPDC059657]|uniref:hypothetical protein n=1 Tax=Amycolatopsis sp. NPDC059657 TaxID=3346899 RepID=UPI00366ED9CE